MGGVMLDKEQFLKKYHIKEDQFNQINLPWEDLNHIYIDYESSKNNIETILDNIVKELRQCKNIHSIRARVKDSEHLIEKIIRKKIQTPEWRISIENYKNEITDIIGVRVICLFKKNMQEINKYIQKLEYESTGKIEVNIRKGDDERPYSNIGVIKVRKTGYRSIHYNYKVQDIRGKKIICEIQLRTIFEEAWGEIDHTIRYPYLQDDPHLNDYFKVLNRLSGLADEMTNFSEDLVKLITKAKKSEEAVELNGELRRLKKELAKKDEKISKYEKELKMNRDRKRKVQSITLEPSVATLSATEQISLSPSRSVLEDSITSTLGHSISGSVGASLANSTRSALVDSVRSSLGHSISGSVGASLANSTRSALVDSVRSSLGHSISGSVGASLANSVKSSAAICSKCNTVNFRPNHVCSKCGNLL
ncbi:hypothetical protein DYH56_03335 [Psychrilyobacter piezotolerans]|uniref:RelA/SpoT domain-containing protein n=2 Tax=Fusobacteriaceae TaxID=203492 RepID=A0ABX9KJU0_9FUSO|nr:hypothetical protein DV867_03335 [Psychrilyobacter sp. S5]REI42399.1 hypothetical protein DYH56_03335 [Psychrilyobacter piezotolerans]